MEKTTSIIILLLVFLSVPVCSWAQERAPAIVVDATGEVQAKPSDSALWKPVTSGQELVEGASIRSGLNSSAVIEFGPGHRAHLDEATTIKLSELKYPGEDATEKTTINLTVGRILNKVKKLKTSDSEYSVQTPTASAAVRGTIYEVAYNAETKKTDVRVLEGLIDMQARIGRRLSMSIGEREKSGVGADGVLGPRETMSESEVNEMNETSSETDSAGEESGDDSSEMGQMDSIQSEMNDRMDAIQNRLSDDNRANRLNDLRNGDDDDF